MGRLREIVVDADVPSRLARFWAEAIEEYAIRPYDEAEIARLAALGLTPETDPSVLLDGPGPVLCFQLKSGPRPERNRLHFDIETADRTAEIARLTALGATFWRETEGYTVLRDPEGNQFCVVGPKRG
jgi:Glyoxalase-like domain